MRKKHSILLITFLMTFCVGMSALPRIVSAEEGYERKSISYIDTLLLATPNAEKISPDEAGQLLDTIKGTINGMKRFDDNPLSEGFTQKFLQKARQEKPLTMERIAGILRETLAGYGGE